jgi:hypothetical protein
MNKAPRKEIRESQVVASKPCKNWGRYSIITRKLKVSSMKLQFPCSLAAVGK